MKSMKSMKSSVSANIGGKIKKIRKSAGISGAELSHKLGVSQQQVSRYELGQSAMTIDIIVMIANILDTSLIELLADYLISECNSNDLFPFFTIDNFKYKKSS
ncbi:helix-turn-helix domain-containing protein [Morganella morganii]|uniref:helix-turn-helix domain-containing protein n=1 Tax=Morganella morganii TaxID=582 RepID=UPI0006915C4D|nr:helix-turn-helix transcriptional regulator [Morganella morganii]